jgi:hypothetical protein
MGILVYNDQPIEQSEADGKANGDPVESVRWKKSIIDELMEALA